MTDQKLAPGDVAPDFSLSDADGQTVTLSGLRGQRVIVYFYPAAMTPGCTKKRAISGIISACWLAPV